MDEAVRIDKWLWSVRVFKTRSQATEACRAGKVKLEGLTVKPSREVHRGELFVVNTGDLIRSLKVTAILHHRVGAKLVQDFMEDQTPVEEFERQEMRRTMRIENRPRGSGRPTKKERRQIDRTQEQ